MHEFAEGVADQLVTVHRYKASEVKSSPFLDMLKELLAQLLPMLIQCLPVAATADDVLAAMKDLGPLQILLMRRKIHRQMPDDTFVGALVSSIRRQARMTEVAEVQEAMDEIG